MDRQMAIRILVVDDEENICEYLAELFGLEGWDTDMAHDGRQGARMAMEADYDVIIMDMLMPHMNGFEATRQILKHRPDAKVIIMTGAPYRRQAQEAADSGAKTFIKKPFLCQTIIEAVKKILSEEI